MTKKLIILLALMISVTFGVVKPVQAQALMVDTASIETACVSDAVLCGQLIAAALAQLEALGLDPAVINQQIGALTAKLVAVVTTITDPTLLSAISGAIVSVAGASTDPLQEAAILAIATVVEDGDAGTLDTTDPVLYASPA